MIKRLLLSSFILLSIFYSYGQETTSQILGTVSDGKQGLAGATVVALHGPTGTKYTTTTRKDGRYNLEGLRVGGPYTLTVSYVGFKEQKTEGITLALGADYTGDFQMVSDTKELATAIVSAGRQNKIFNSSHTGSQEIISHDQLQKLPTINRSVQDFTRLEPTSNGSSFGGRSSQYNNITVDGANFNNGFGLSATLGGQTGSQPIALDAIDQIQVNVSPYDVRQGGFTGAGINAVTKSGTNTFQGSVYTYLKGPGTQGYLVETNKIPRAQFSYYTRGAYLGGAFIPDKLFFFVSYEEVNQTVPAYTQVAATPSQPANGNTVSQASASALDSLKSFLTNSQYKLDPGSYQGYSFVTNSKKLTAKIDFNLNKANVLTLKYNRLRSYSQNPQSTSRTGAGFSRGPAAFSYVYGLPFSGSGYAINNNFDIYILELNTRFGNKLSNKFQAGYTRERDPRSPGTNNPFPFVDILNGTGNTYGSQVLTSFGYETYTYGNLINTDVYQISDIATMYKGAHEITFGTQDYSRKYTDAFSPNYAGGYQFPSLQAFYTAATGGAAVDRYFQEWSNIPGGPFPQYSAGSTEIGLFVQDKWRATTNFTLVYGLRYDLTIYKQIYLDNPYFDALTFKDGKSYNIGKAPGNASLLAPRVGFNWDVFGNHQTQVRGGAGWFNGPPPFVWLANQPGNNGVLIASGNFTNVPLTANAVTNPPAGVNTVAPSKIQSATSYSAAVTAPNFKYPTVIKSSIAIDQKAGDGWVFTAEASYSKDVNAVYFSNLNLNESSAFAISNGGDHRLRYLTATANSNKYYYGAGGATQANPSLGTAILLANSKKGFAYTLTARVQKTWENLHVSVAYTYSQAKNVATGGSTASSLWSGRNVGNVDPNADNLSYADYYQPHRIIAFADYRVLYGKNFATSVGLFYEAVPAGVGSYTYGGSDVNGDGNSSTNLIYIPVNQNDINLVKVGSGGNGTGASNDPRTVSQIWNQLNNFISQDHYLSGRRGHYVQANAVVFPWWKHMDMNITQDFYYQTKHTGKHTIRLSMDLVNVGNFLNKYWGIVKQQTTSTPLTFEGMAADGKTPSFSFPYLDAANQVPLVNSYTDNTGISSRWQMQFGIRYLFN